MVCSPSVRTCRLRAAITALLCCHCSSPSFAVTRSCTTATRSSSSLSDALPLDPRDREENEEWLESFESVVKEAGRARAGELLSDLIRRARELDVPAGGTPVTNYVNTIPHELEPPYPGDEAIEA